jgi:hypothetical protein
VDRHGFDADPDPGPIYISMPFKVLLMLGKSVFRVCRSKSRAEFDWIRIDNTDSWVSMVLYIILYEGTDPYRIYLLSSVGVCSKPLSPSNVGDMDLFLGNEDSGHLHLSVSRSDLS